MLPSAVVMLLYLALGLAAGVLLVREFKAEFTIQLWGRHLPDLLVVSFCVFAGLLALHAAILSVSGYRFGRQYAAAHLIVAAATFAAAAAVLGGPEARVPAAVVAAIAFVNSHAT